MHENSVTFLVVTKSSKPAACSGCGRDKPLSGIINTRQGWCIFVLVSSLFDYTATLPQWQYCFNERVVEMCDVN